MSEESKACPFCGGTDISEGEVLSNQPVSDSRINSATQSMCRECGALGPEAPLQDGEIDYGDIKAIAAWNRRAQSGISSPSCMPNITCSMCGEGRLHSGQAPNTISTVTGPAQVTLHFHWCDACGVEISTSKDARANITAARSARRGALKSSNKEDSAVAVPVVDTLEAVAWRYPLSHDHLHWDLRYFLNRKGEKLRADEEPLYTADQLRKVAVTALVISMNTCMRLYHRDPDVMEMREQIERRDRFNGAIAAAAAAIGRINIDDVIAKAGKE